MKNTAFSYLGCACLVLSAFLVGLYLGRGMSGGVETQVLSPSAPTVSTTGTQATSPTDDAVTQPSKPAGNTITQPTSPTVNNGTQPTKPGADTVAPETQAPTVPAKININSASVEQLMTLPGIGEVYAKRIVEYRTINGPFKTISDITKVEGIGKKRFEAIKDQITVGG